MHAALRKQRVCIISCGAYTTLVRRPAPSPKARLLVPAIRVAVANQELLPHADAALRAQLRAVACSRGRGG